MKIIKTYFGWLQKDVPTGDVEKYPEIDSNGETSVKGIFIIGDLTGIPLLKLAAESGKKIIDFFNSSDEFKKIKKNKKENDVLDVLIVGAGPAGVAAGIEALKSNFSFVILEAAKKFNTIMNFPKAKPIIAAPEEYQQQSELIINDGVKESLLDELSTQIKNINLPIEEGVIVDKIEKEGNHFIVATKEKKYKALRVVLAIGKSGNSRLLNVPGEDLPKVFNRLIDPEEAHGLDVLIVGGGDSALETAIAVASCAKSVTLSYRRSSFARPKEQNSDKLASLVQQEKINLLLESNVKEVKSDSVLISTKEGVKEISNSIIYTLIGKELPTAFLKRNNIKMEGELSVTAKLQFLLLLLVSGVIYFGKSSEDLYSHFFGKINSWTDVFSNIFSVAFWGKFFLLPVGILKVFASSELKIWNVTEYVNAFIAYFSLIGVVVFGSYLLYKFFKDYGSQIKPNWQTFKYFYFITISLFFTIVFFGGRYFGIELFGKSQGFWYTGLYSLTILIFGLRRMQVNPTKYIKYQTWTLILVQALPLFILPEFLFPFLGKVGVLGNQDGFILTQVFPNESYWRSYGFILAWPLFISNVYNSSVTTFWLVFSFMQTFILIPYIVYRWGKGAYCGWICSCGALAETLGNEYRTLAPHGTKAKKLENTGQWILFAAFLVTGMKLLSILYDFNIPIINEKISYSADILHNIYHFSIDIIFAGVLGVGVYFFLSGRVWCRFGCPLAAWMHIVNRFSRYRIFSDKKKCISCNICTKVCHMGIDVMNFANKGIPMNDVECVRCSACVVNCPTQVLSFGSLAKADPDNELYKITKLSVLDQSDWQSGL
ncbi:MAG: NAD(P)-binding domain-containing protein [Ignavibacteriales bacterium]|nr:NAD(P)-binding domain-containing protein [Ignavibacteriales bacterium]